MYRPMCAVTWACRVARVKEGRATGRERARNDCPLSVGWLLVDSTARLAFPASVSYDRLAGARTTQGRCARCARYPAVSFSRARGTAGRARLRRPFTRR